MLFFDLGDNLSEIYKDIVFPCQRRSSGNDMIMESQKLFLPLSLSSFEIYGQAYGGTDCSTRYFIEGTQT